jgi:hypothetical protein
VQASLQQFTRSLYFAISPLVFSSPSLDKRGPYDPEDNGQDSPSDGVEEDIILQILDQGMKDFHCLLFSLIPGLLPSKISILKVLIITFPFAFGRILAKIKTAYT